MRALPTGGASDSDDKCRRNWTLADAIASAARSVSLVASGVAAFPLLLASFLATPLLGGDVTQRRRSRVSFSELTDSGYKPR